MSKTTKACQFLSFLLSVFLLSSVLFAQPLKVTTYDELLFSIRQTRQASERRIEAAVEREKVREAWETGKLIDEHILLHQERAEYDKEVMPKLARDLQTSESELYRMLKFSRVYPKVAPGQELSWSHYRALLSVDDPEEREALGKEAVEKNWTRNQLREEIQTRKAGANLGAENSVSSILPGTKPGIPGVYRISQNRVGELFVDLGFSNYLSLKEKIFRPGDLVRLEKGKLKKFTGGPEALYTYTGTVWEVLDGDTLRVEIEQGFGITTVQKLRLKGIDAPELISAEGKRAKEFVEKVIEGGRGKVDAGRKDTSSTFPPLPSTVMVRTLKSDKYDRYLADIWVGEKYLNQELLDAGLAVRVRE